ncbi:MAG: hypothetical protein K6A32_01545 [Bacteroidales bacterium]|nr:hypothetical protein [Bacteroidales bacterium]
MKKKLLLLIAAGLMGRMASVQAEDYTLTAAAWAYTGNAGRIAQDNISVTDNVITLSSVSGANNAALKFGSDNSYTFSHSATRLIIKGTNLSTEVSAHAIWWLNNGNNGSSQNPASATEADGVVTLTWNLAEFPYAMRQYTLGAWTLSYAGTSTIFGLTPAATGDVTITDIEWECVSSEYSYDAEDWAYTGDAKRISQDNISTSGNVITLSSV